MTIKEAYEEARRKHCDAKIRTQGLPFLYIKALQYPDLKTLIEEECLSAEDITADDWEVVR